MSTALVSAIRDLGTMYKALQSQNSSNDLQQHAAVLERQLYNQLGSYSACAMINNNNNNIPPPPPATSAKKHPPLTYCNSVALPIATSAKISLSSSNAKEHKKLDRSVSEPIDRSYQQQQQQPRPSQSNSSRYKTELCRPFEENGTCKYGDKCQFAHGINELRTLARHPKYKTELCRTFHTTGFCPYGPRCHFIHNDFSKMRSSCISIPNGSSQSNQPSAKSDLDMGSFSLGSAGDLSPNSSSISGSPTSSNGFSMDDAFSPVPMSHTAQPYRSTSTSGSFFGPDFALPYPVINGLAFQQQQQQQQQSPPSTFQVEHQQQNLLSQMEILNKRMDCMNLNSVGSPLVDNANLRLPIFNQFATVGSND